MVNFLLSSLVPLTLIMVILLLVRQPLRSIASASISYSLWSLLPLAIIMYSMPLPWHYISELNNSEIQTYLVQPNTLIHQQLTNEVFYSYLLQGLWFFGVCSIITYWLITHYSFKGSLKACAIDNATLSSQLHAAIPHNLAIKQSSHIYSPMLIGLIKPTIVIPENFNELYNPEQQTLIIDHEVCHYSHHHMWANQLALVLLALFWFHPLAWRAYALFRQDQEHSCDQAVLARKQPKSRIQYCKALVLAAETSPPNAFTLMSFKHNGEQNFMLNRIKQIKTMPKANYSKLSLVTLVSLSLLAGVSYAGNHLKTNKTVVEQAKINVHPIHRIEPKYPIEAAKKGIEGSVVLKYDIQGDGNVTNVEVVNGKPAYVFDKTAITALKQWRYKATGKTTKNLLVQLDYLLSAASAKPEPLIERIKVTK